MLWHWFGAMVWRMNIARIDIARMWPGVYAWTGLTLACSQREKVGALQLHLSCMHTYIHTTYIHTYLPFYLLDLSPPPLSFLPSPTPLQPLKLIIGRSWLVGLSGPLIFFWPRWYMQENAWSVASGMLGIRGCDVKDAKKTLYKRTVQERTDPTNVISSPGAEPTAEWRTLSGCDRHGEVEQQRHQQLTWGP